MSRLMDVQCSIFSYSGMLSTHKKKDILPFSPSRLDFDGIMLDEVSQTEKNTVGPHSQDGSENTEFSETVGQRLLGAEGRVRRTDASQREQTFSFKMMKIWISNGHIAYS